MSFATSPQRTIRGQLATLAALAVLPIAIFISLDYLDRIARRTELAGEFSGDLAAVASTLVAQIIGDERDMLEALAARPAQRIERPAQCEPVLADARVLQPRRRNILVVTRSGEVVCSVIPIPRSVDASVVDRSHVQRLLQTGQFIVGEPLLGRFSGRWVLPLLHPRRDEEGRLIGGIGGPLDLEHLGRALARAPLAGGHWITLISPQGKVVASSADTLKWVGTDVHEYSFPAALLDGSLAQWEGAGIDGVVRVWTLREVPGFGMKVVAGANTQFVRANANATLARDIALYMVVLLAVMVLCLRMGRRISTPVLALAQTARKVAAGDRSARAPRGGPEEIDAVADEFNRMLDAQHIADERLRESEDRYRDLVEHSQDLICTHDLDGRILSVNPWAAKMLGYDSDELLNMSLRDIVAPGVRHELNAYLTAIRANGVASGLLLVQTRAGEKRLWEYDNTLRTDGVTTPIVRGMARDVTEGKRAEQALQKNRALLAAIVNGTTDAVYVKDVDGRYMLLNPAAQKFLGRSEAEVLGQVDTVLIPSAEAVAMMSDDRDVIASGAVRTREDVVTNASGETRTLLTTKGPVTEVGGKAVGVFGISRDISDRKQAERDRAWLAAIVDQATVAIITRKLDGTILTWNAGAERMLGHTAAEVVGKSIALTPPGRPDSLARNNEKLLNGEVTARESDRLTKDGRVIDVLTSLSPIRDSAGNVVAVSVILQDITALKRAQAAVEESEERLRLAVTGADLGTWHWHIPSGELVWSDRCLAMFGIPLDTCMSHGKFLAALHPGDRARADDAVQRALKEHAEYDIEFRSLWPDGTVHWAASKGRAYLDEAGTAVRMEGVALDITERKVAEHERRRLMQRLVEIQEIDRREISRELHDRLGVNLSAVALILQATRAQLPAESLPTVGPRLANAQAALQDAVRDVRDLMADLRPPTLDDYGLISALEAYAAPMSARLGVPIAITGAEPAPRLPITAETALFRIAQEALSNITKHARASRIAIGIAEADGFVSMSVQDDGAGFDTAAGGDPAHVTWGLTTMRERAEAMGARLHIESAPGYGTCVTVEVPRDSGNPAVA